MVNYTANAQTIHKPSVPEFTVKYVYDSYYVPETYKIDPYTGKSVIASQGCTEEKKSLQVINLAFTPVLDANGNYRNKGTTTSDNSGTFAIIWKPDIPGLYQIVGRFTGSDSYGSSLATTYVNVEEGLQQTTEPDQSPYIS